MYPFQPTQEHRFLSINTEAGENVLLLRQFQGEDEISRPFQYEADLVSIHDDIDIESLLGTPATVRLEMADPQGGDGMVTRYFNGIISRFAHVGYQRMGMARYRATLVPKLWFLTRTSDCRIYKGTVVEILKKLCEDAGFTPDDSRLEGDFKYREFCVQYRETDFNFASRLMEQEGIYYFHEHQQGQHTLVLANTPGAHKPWPGFKEIIYRGSTSGYQDRPYIHRWKTGKEVKPGIYVHNDFDFTQPKPKPNERLVSKYPEPKKHALADFEIYDAPGDYRTTLVGDKIAHIRLQEAQAQYETAVGETVARGLCTGCTFKLTEYPRADQNIEHLVLRTHFNVKSADFASGETDAQSFYACHFTTIPAATQWRSPRITPEPRIEGPQTAMVVCGAGKEIDCDEYGRVRLQFHWDRNGKSNADSSCWVRVAQGWAGIQWGHMFLPRKGQEVIVEFLEGNPDRPIVTGRVYNAVCKPPYNPTIADERAKSTIKSLSTPDGEGFNELRFDDEKGKEQIFIHAQNDFHSRTLAEAREWVGGDRHLIIKKGSQHEQVKGDKHQIVGGEKREEIGDSLSMRVGRDIQISCGQNYGLQAGNEVHVQAGGSIVIESTTGVSLKVGGNHVTVHPGGVTINGSMVYINSSGPGPMGGSDISPASPVAPLIATDGLPGGVSKNEASPSKPSILSIIGKAVTSKLEPFEDCFQKAAQNGTAFVTKVPAVSPAVASPAALAALAPGAGGNGAAPAPAGSSGLASLGSLSSRYESAKDGAAAIGEDGTGGYSYGTYQIATKTGTMDSFISSLQTTNPAYAQALNDAGGADAAKAGTPEFQAAWEKLATDDPGGFAQAQHDFIGDTHYTPVADNLRDDVNLDVSQRSKALQDVVWSTSVQHGAPGGTNVIENALSGKDPSTMSDDQIIKDIYAERGRTDASGNMVYFSKSTPAVQASVANRFNNEEADALKEYQAQPPAVP